MEIGVYTIFSTLGIKALHYKTAQVLVLMSSFDWTWTACERHLHFLLNCRDFRACICEIFVYREICAHIFQIRTKIKRAIDAAAWANTIFFFGGVGVFPLKCSTFTNAEEALQTTNIYGIGITQSEVSPFVFNIVFTSHHDIYSVSTKEYSPFTPYQFHRESHNGLLREKLILKFN